MLISNDFSSFVSLGQPDRALGRTATLVVVFQNMSEIFDACSYNVQILCFVVVSTFPIATIVLKGREEKAKTEMIYFKSTTIR
jgi:hypothetical protein